MKKRNWQEVFALFSRALETPDKERTRLLENACRGDGDLREQVELLLAQHDEQGILDQGESLALPWLEDDGSQSPQIDNYRLLDLLGEGGMGLVYAAEQERPVRRRVALKLIKLGMDTREVLARFEAERQALAMMNHTNIAKILDAGMTAGGRPYFAMEFVAGVWVTEYCDAKRLDLHQRLELFLPICQALQHAHQKGVMHRDIKPSNVMVAVDEGRPVPKVIDFGVAKAIGQRLTEQTLFTQDGRMIGTPAYMSPEQAQTGFLGVDTRSDVYSLGVLLYELLVGHRPFAAPPSAGRSPVDLQQLIRPDEPPMPSAGVVQLDNAVEVARQRGSDPKSLAHELRGELDWIVIKTIQKDRTRRYQSAGELADDIRRYLERQPVLAGPPGVLYPFRKFVRRHWLAAAATTAIGLLVLALALTMTLQSIRISRALGQAEVERERAEQVTGFLVKLFEYADPFGVRGEQLTAREVLDAGATYTGAQLVHQPKVRATLLDAIAAVYLNLGLYDDALATAKESYSVRSHFSNASLEAIDTLELLGRIHTRRSEYAAAVKSLEQVVAYRRQTVGERDPQFAASLLYLSAARRFSGDLDTARRLADQALKLRRARPDGAYPALPEFLDELAEIETNRGNDEAGEALFSESLALRRATSQTEDARIALTLSRLGKLLQRRGDFEGAEPLLRESLALYRNHLGPKHAALSEPINTLALLLHFDGRLAAAETLYSEALSINRSINRGKNRGVAVQLNNLALLRHDQGKLVAAADLFRQSLALLGELHGEQHIDLAFPLNNLARVLHTKGDLEPAEVYYRRALTLRQDGLPPGHVRLADSLVWLGALLTDAGRPREAEPLLREGVEIRRRELKTGNWQTAEAESLLGHCWAALGKFAAAEPLVVQGHQALVAQRGTSWPRTQMARKRVRELYRAWNKPARAADYEE